MAAPPPPGAVPWGELHDVPTAIVTGSNGKTTTVRLPWPRAPTAGPAPSGTDGVPFDGIARARRLLGPEGAPGDP